MQRLHSITGNGWAMDDLQHANVHFLYGSIDSAPWQVALSDERRDQCETACSLGRCCRLRSQRGGNQEAGQGTAGTGRAGEVIERKCVNFVAEVV